MTRILKKAGTALVTLLACLSFSQLYAQNRQITGTVTSSENNQPLAGATVSAQGTRTSVVTNEQGRFTISVPENTSTLVVSYTGYNSQEVAVAGKSNVSVTLTTDIRALNDVVVVGYQTVRRKDLTGSVSSVNARQLKDIPINSAAQALAGRLAGVQISGTEGSPNAAVTIRVRGGGSITQDNSPLFIIDGVQVENALNNISPQDIETIDVLKDASATAIYGSRGANGVVIITTKGGKSTKTTISYNGFIGMSRLANKLEVMQPYDFVTYQYERNKPNGNPDSSSFLQQYGTTWDTLNNYKNVPFIDWQDEMFGRNAISQTHNVTLTGGTRETQYNLSLTSNKEDGLMLGSGFDRKLVSFKFDHNFNSNLKVGFATRFNNTKVTGAGTSNGGSSSNNRLRQSVKYRPLLVAGQDVDDYDPSYAAQTNSNSLSLVNPILLNEAEYRKNLNNVVNLTAYAELKLTKFLTLRSTAGFDFNSLRQNTFDDTITNNSKLNGAGQPMASIGTSEVMTINNSNVLTLSSAGFKGNFVKKNVFSVLVGQEIYQSRTKGTNILAKLFPVGISPTKALGNMNLGTAFSDPSRLPSSEYEEHLSSFFGRINYAYDDKYLLTLTLRGDGSSKFAEDNKWGYFPSGAFAWRVSNEKFFEGIKTTISDLKFKVSYGEAGNNRIPNFGYLTQFLANTQYWLNDQLVTAYSPASLANVNLTWETTVSRNIGVDIGLFRNRLLISADVYRNTTEDLLVNVPIPTSSGYTSQIQNVGSTENKGVEVQLNGTILQKKDFSWTANFNMSANKNKVTSLGTYQKSFLINSGWGLSSTPSDYIVRVGDPVGAMWGFVTDGYYSVNDFDFNSATGAYTLKQGIASNQSIVSTIPQPGAMKFKDLDGNGLINDLDKKIIGVAQPKVFGGLNQQVTWKNFDLSVFVNYQFGNDVYNANKLEFTSGYTVNSNLLAIMNDRWKNVDPTGKVLLRVVSGTVYGVSPAELTANNTNAKLWSASTAANSFTLHSWAVEDGSFVRINNITVGYTLPSEVISKARLQRARVYFTVNNLHVFTNYSGYDPEVSTRRTTPVTPGVDYSAYPRSRSFIFGINITL